MPSVEFSVDGVPVSHQTKNPALRAKYKGKVQGQATKAMAGAHAWTEKVAIHLWILTIDDAAPENDNVIKLIRDALQGIVYLNDRQVHRDHLIRHDLMQPVVLCGLPDRLVALATRGEPFVYVRVSTDVQWTVIT